MQIYLNGPNLFLLKKKKSCGTTVMSSRHAAFLHPICPAPSPYFLSLSGWAGAVRPPPSGAGRCESHGLSFTSSLLLRGGESHEVSSLPPRPPLLWGSRSCEPRALPAPPAPSLIPSTETPQPQPAPALSPLTRHPSCSLLLHPLPGQIPTSREKGVNVHSEQGPQPLIYILFFTCLQADSASISLQDA